MSTGKPTSSSASGSAGETSSGKPVEEKSAVMDGNCCFSRQDNHTILQKLLLYYQKRIKNMFYEIDSTLRLELKLKFTDLDTKIRDVSGDGEM